jgi:hypothetical protein
MLKTAVFYSFQDYLIIGFMIVENLQLIGIGPELMENNYFITQISAKVSFSMTVENSYTSLMFWSIFYSLLAISYIWVLSMIVSVLRIPLLKRCCGGKIDYIKEYLTPFATTYLFIPITSVLLSILECDTSTGSNINQSYLNYDCSQSCWTNTYIIIAIPALILLIFYIPMAIHFQTKWQANEKSANIKTDSMYLFIKYICHVILIIFGKIFLNNYELAHAILYEMIVIGIFIINLSILPYNFDRVNLWSKIMIACVIWNGFTSILNICLKFNNFITLIQILGLALLLICGIVLQFKLPPSLITFQKGKRVYDLMRFGFGVDEYISTMNYIFESIDPSSSRTFDPSPNRGVDSPCNSIVDPLSSIIVELPSSMIVHSSTYRVDFIDE